MLPSGVFVPSQGADCGFLRHRLLLGVVPHADAVYPTAEIGRAGDVRAYGGDALGDLRQVALDGGEDVAENLLSRHVAAVSLSELRRNPHLRRLESRTPAHAQHSAGVYAEPPGGGGRIHALPLVALRHIQVAAQIFHLARVQDARVVLRVADGRQSPTLQRVGEYDVGASVQIGLGERLAQGLEIVSAEIAERLLEVVVVPAPD